MEGTGGGGWSVKVDLSDCMSQKLVDSQLYKWSELLILGSGSKNNVSTQLLNSYQALQLAAELEQITKSADDDDDLLNYEVILIKLDKIIGSV